MTMKFEYFRTDEFTKDLKKLLKRFRTLEEDLRVAQEYDIKLYHSKCVDSRSIFPLQGFYSEKIQIYKIKKFTCKVLKGKGSRSGIRVVYAFHKLENKIVYIEIYYKDHDGDDVSAERIRHYLEDK
jgi:hypothetical protein